MGDYGILLPLPPPGKFSAQKLGQVWRIHSRWYLMVTHWYFTSRKKRSSMRRCLSPTAFDLMSMRWTWEDTRFILVVVARFITISASFSLLSFKQRVTRISEAVL